MVNATLDCTTRLIVVLLFAVGCSVPVSAAVTWLQTLDFPSVVVRFKAVASGSEELATAAFVLHENDVPVSAAHVLQRSPKQALIFLIDRSSSTLSAIGEIKRSAARFLVSLPKEAQIALLSFASDVEINQFFTKDRRKLVNALQKIRHWGGTALYDAMYTSCELLYTDSDPEDPRTLVLFTDGKDETPALRTTMSIRSLDDVLAMASRNKIRVMAVGMGDEVDKDILKKIADETEGWFLFAPNAQQLASAYSQISQRLQAERYFQIRFTSPNPAADGSLRKVLIQCPPESGGQRITLEYTASSDQTTGKKAGTGVPDGGLDGERDAAMLASATRVLPLFQPSILEAPCKGADDPLRHLRQPHASHSQPGDQPAVASTTVETGQAPAQKTVPSGKGTGTPAQNAAPSGQEPGTPAWNTAPNGQEIGTPAQNAAPNGQEIDTTAQNKAPSGLEIGVPELGDTRGASPQETVASSALDATSEAH